MQAPAEAELTFSIWSALTCGPAASMPCCRRVLSACNLSPCLNACNTLPHLFLGCTRILQSAGGKHAHTGGLRRNQRFRSGNDCTQVVSLVSASDHISEARHARQSCLPCWPGTKLLIVNCRPLIWRQVSRFLQSRPTSMHQICLPM